MYKRGITVVLLALSGASMALPVLAQKKIAANYAKGSLVAYSSEPAKVSFTASQDIQTDIDQSIDRFIAAETSHLSDAEQQALHVLMQMELEDDTLLALSDFSKSDSTAQSLQAQLKSNLKLSGLSTDTAELKFSPAVFAAARLAGHMRSIGKAALLGNVIGAIRAAEFDFPAMFSALSSGDTQEFSNLLSEALPRQTTFVEAISTGATFACNTATIDLTPSACSRFSGFMRSTLVRYQRSSKR